MSSIVTARRVPALATVAFITFVSSPAPVIGQAPSGVIISEVHPSGSGNATYKADWIELTNTGSSPVNISGWKIDDNSNAFASAVPLRGVTIIPPGKSAVFFEGLADGSTDAAIRSAFTSAWFGTPSTPLGLLIGAYGGSGIGLGTGGDAVNLFDASGTVVTAVTFGAATASRTFDNAAGLGSITIPGPAISTLSTAGTSGAFTASGETGSPGRIAAPVSFSTIDLSRYVRVGRFPLPEPITTPLPPGTPAGNLLAQEASAVTYNWDTDTLFVTGDGGKSITQVSKTGQLIDTMTLADGSSPQGTDFYDPEGLTYVGNGRFVMSEERDRQAVLFNYAAGTLLTRAQTQTVKLGTFAPNIGNEGLSYDPLTNGFIFVKETNPQGIFQTNIDFAAGTASNGSATTENPINLFDPALLGLADLADVFALSNLPTISGPGAGNLLVLSQESGRILNVDRNGIIASSLAIQPSPGDLLPIIDMQHEGLTMDGNGILYIVNENGGGNIDHPELWVYAPSAAPNQAPTGITLANQTTSIPENTVISPRRKVADVVIADDGLGINDLTLSGADAASFEVDVNGLYLKAGTSLDFETKAVYQVTVDVNDASIGATPDASASFTLNVSDVSEGPVVLPLIRITEVAPWGSGSTPYASDWFELTNMGTTPVNLSGWRMDDDSNSFASARALTGISTVAPGESVIFMETPNNASFLSTWFGAAAPATLQIGAYTGAGVGLSTGGDAVNIFDASGNVVTRVTFGVSPSGPFPSFDNAAGLDNAVLTQASVAGVNGAFAAAGDAAEIGSPGLIAAAPMLIISEVAAWSSSSTVGADWFEVTNIGASAASIAGWKVDDSSESPAGAVPLNGVTTIAPGESVIFFETANLDATKALFIDSWFGGAAPAGLQFGSYTGSGLGLSTGGDAVNLFNQFNVLKAKVFFNQSPAASPLATFDNAAGLNGHAALIGQLSVAGVNGAFLSSSGDAIGSPGTIFADTIAPVISAAGDMSVSAVGPSGANASYVMPVATDNVDFNVAVSCAPASGSLFPIGRTTVTCNASDAAHNVSTATFVVTVTEVTTPGEMRGDGYLNAGSVRYSFDFAVRETARSGERGSFELRVDEERVCNCRDRRGRGVKHGDRDEKTHDCRGNDRHDRFQSRGIDFIAFTDDPTFRPGRQPRPQVDTVVFSGTGDWNGRRGYRFEARATDQGEPGRHREMISITITDPSGNVVATVDGDLDGGNIQSTRIDHGRSTRWW